MKRSFFMLSIWISATRSQSTDSQDSVVAKAMHVCHNLMDTRGDVFKGSDFQGFKSGMIDPTSFDLMTASGACGSYSMVLARVLQGYKFRCTDRPDEIKWLFCCT